MTPPRFFNDTDADIARVVELLRAGELVALPTETVYGLGADALNDTAVRRIFETKGRPLIDPLILHVAEFSKIENYAEVPFSLNKLSEKFWPGPLTVVLKKKDNVSALVTAGNDTVAIRVPAHQLMRKVLQRFDGAIAAPSANPFGYVSPTTAAHVRDSLGEKVPFILDGGTCEHGLESTIIALANDTAPTLLRPGPIPREDLEAALGSPVSFPQKKVSEKNDTDARQTDKQAQPAPGMLTKHYSPRAKVFLRNENSPPPFFQKNNAKKIAIVWLKRPRNFSENGTDFWLSEDGNPATAAHNIFALLRTLDTENFSEIHVELTADTGIGIALNDRLHRASAKN